MNAPLRILLIEDNPGDAVLLENMLNETGVRFELKCVRRISMGIEQIKTAIFDVIMLDLGLPDSYGLETLKQFITFEPKAPVIVLTGLDDEVVGTEAVKAGAQDYLVKGQIDKNLLSRSISYAIERKRTSEEILAAGREWSAFFDAMSDGVSIHGVDNTIIKANQSLFKLLGKSEDEVIGKKCYQLFHGTECPIPDCPISKSRDTNLRAYSEIFEPTLNKWLAVSASPVLDNSGYLTRIVHTIRDITEHRKLEEQLRQSQKMESIGTLAGGIAHDFNNILTAIIGYGELALMKMADDNPQRSNIQHMLDASNRATYLTKDLLLFSRKQAADRKPVNFNMVLGHVGKFLLRVIGEDITFKTAIYEAPLPVLADEHQLEQVLMNLATNARDAMPQGGTFTLSAEIVNLDREFVAVHHYGKPGFYALITATDTGWGMDESTRQRIFEPFFTTKEAGKGTGLGMAVVYGIIKQHEGYIKVYSEPGTGTTFRIYLPLIATESLAEKHAEPEDVVASGTETILLAEDDAIVRELIKCTLTNFGYKVIEAFDGVDALTVFRENSHTINLLLFDMIMPHMNGMETYDEIRKTSPEIKAIFTSGYAPDALRLKLNLADGVHLICKPISPTALLHKVRSVLDGKTS